MSVACDSNVLTLGADPMMSPMATGFAFERTEDRVLALGGAVGKLGFFAPSPGLRIVSEGVFGDIVVLEPPFGFGAAAGSSIAFFVAGLINEEKASASALLIASSSEGAADEDVGALYLIWSAASGKESVPASACAALGAALGLESPSQNPEV